MVDLSLAVAGFAGLVGLLALSAFFSSSETAIFSLPPAWLDERVRAGDRRAATLQALRGDPHRLLVTLLVGNNVVNVAISSVITAVAAAALPPGQAVVAATAVASVVVLIFGEIVPKSFGLGRAERWSLAVAGPLRLVERALSPVVGAFDLVTRRLTVLIGGEIAIEAPYLDD